MSFFDRSSNRFVKNNTEGNNDETSKFNFYETLGIDKNASDQQIKDAYKRSALKYHPDRNLGNEEALENFKKISIAYSVLSDQNKRRQYDMTGGDPAISNFDGFDMSEVSGLNRFFSAVITKIGIPFPTVITPRVLAQARKLCTNASEIKTLQSGFPITGFVKNQEAFFFRVQMDEKFAEQGVIIQCKSSTMSKFKLVLFDSEGGVRMLKDSQKRKNCTSAEMFFVPFQRVEVSKPSTLSIRMDDKETPMPFHYLDNLETQGAQSLRDGNHILCIYGDNFYQAVRYRLNFLLLNKDCQPTVTKLNLIEPRLIEKRIQMADFQKEYMDLKKRYEAASNRLKAEDRTISQLLHEREHAYEELFETCLLSNAPVSLSTKKPSGKNLFSSFFS